MSVKERSLVSELTKGFLIENPVFALILGMCPTLAVTTSVASAIGMGLATTIVLIGSNTLISLLKKFIPDEIRIPAYIVIIATFVTVIELSLKALLPDLSKTLGVYVQLIVVNCIILGRAEAFASKKSVLPSIMDAIGMGLGFTFGLLTISFIRELFATGAFSFTDFGLGTISIPFFKDGAITLDIFGKNREIYSGAMILILPAGGFFVLGFLLAVINKLKNIASKKSRGA